MPAMKPLDRRLTFNYPIQYNGIRLRKVQLNATIGRSTNLRGLQGFSAALSLPALPERIPNLGLSTWT
jgi:hypothetical protein